MAVVEDDPLSLKQIISRYENAEEEFLRELESMQQCANTDTSDEFQESESPVLGTLCSLVTEISQLRKQNRKLRRRLVESSASPTPVPLAPRSNVIHRVSTFLDASRHSFLPKFMSSSSSSHSLNMKKPPSTTNEVQCGARERLSSPAPQLKPKTSLAVSAYSTDLSSDGSLQRRRNTPPLVLPETSDSDADQVFQEVDLPDYDQIDDNCLSPCYPRRSMLRRFHRPAISDNTSPSSAGSSVDRMDTMTSSRSSFLDLIGFRVRRRSKPEIPTGKKRKRRISIENDFQNSAEKRGQSTTQITSAKDLSTLGESDPQKHVSRSLKNVAANVDKPGGGQLSKLNGTNCDSRLSSPSKIRPKSIAAYLHPSDLIKSPRLKLKTKSWRSVASKASQDTNQSYDIAVLDEELQIVQDENMMLRNEIQVLKTRNTQLIENLRDKSMQLSKTQHKIEVQLEESKKREKMNDALDKLFLRERTNRYTESSLNAIEVRLKEFEADLQATKNEALRNQQMVLNSTYRENSAYQGCLEQVERLQRENFSLMQAKASEFGVFDKQLKEKLEVLPRYDALYSFAMRIVKKMGQLRNTLNDKSSRLIRAELELMHQQSALLIAHTQIERQKLKPQVEKRRGPKRPASFHGEDLIEKMTKPHLNVFLPFKLHGARVEQQRKSQSSMQNGVENGTMEEDERMEIEFLKFFDCARFVPHQNGTATPTPEREKQMTPRLENVIVYRNGRATASPMNSPILNERRRFMSGKQSQSPLAARKNQPLVLNSNDEHEQKSQRPSSWIDSHDQRNGNTHQPSTPLTQHYYHHRQESSELRRLADDITNHRISGADNYHLHDFSIQQTNASPIVRYTGRHDHARTNGAMSSLQDISCQNGLRSPSTTPILTRRVPILGSPKLSERRLHKQQSFQTSPNGSSYDNQPLYDSPPRAHESSDYGSIESRTASGLSRRPSNDKRLAGQKPFHLHHRHHSRLPQLHSNTCAFNASNNNSTVTNGNGVTNGVTNNGATNLKRSNAILRRNSPVLSAEQRPSVLRQNAMLAARRTRQSASESPRMMPRFHHQHTVNSAQLNQTINEEDEPLSSAANDLHETNDFLQFDNSRLPKPSNTNLGAAKKVGSSWLNRFRLNSKKVNN